MKLHQKIYVSIPHRYARNLISAAFVTSFFFWFQFLIGTLETREDKGQLLGRRKFQFLIGTLETAAGFIFF